MEVALANCRSDVLVSGRSDRRNRRRWRSAVRRGASVWFPVRSFPVPSAQDPPSPRAAGGQCPANRGQPGWHQRSCEEPRPPAGPGAGVPRAGVRRRTAAGPPLAEPRPSGRLDATVRVGTTGSRPAGAGRRPVVTDCPRRPQRLEAGGPTRPRARHDETLQPDGRGPTSRVPDTTRPCNPTGGPTSRVPRHDETVQPDGRPDQPRAPTRRDRATRRAARPAACPDTTRPRNPAACQPDTGNLARSRYIVPILRTGQMRTKARPMTESSGTGPKRRLSLEPVRLSPITKM
jgi:hypothetical protein